MKEWLRKNKFLLLIIISILAVVGVTFAFFQPQLQSGDSNDVDINANTTDDLQFNIINDISLNINQFNFGINDGNLSSNATATATLLANNSTNTATYTYYVYFRINYNEFVYTSSDSKPEIILSITNPSGQEVTSIEGLNYVTASGADGTQVKGFDITTATGAFAIATNYSITANSTTPTVQEWKLTATFINLDSDQQANTGKTMDAEILIQKDELKPTLADYIISTYTDGSNGLYYHDANLENGAADNSYRYAGANPNNYVCFGSDAASCPSDNLYRIIGVFDSEVKLIKSTSYGSYAWDSNNSNTWSSSTIRGTLNTTYYNTLSTTWQNKIATHTWKVGGMAWSSTNTARQFYDTEVGSSSSSTTDSMKIGLMYVSDYGFAVSPDYWTTALYSYSNSTLRSTNWLYLGSHEWTISPRSSHGNGVFYLDSNGSLYSNDANNGFSARPVFYLNSNVTYVSGDGTESNPYRIS